MVDLMNYLFRSGSQQDQVVTDKVRPSGRALLARLPSPEASQFIRFVRQILFGAIRHSTRNSLSSGIASNLMKTKDRVCSYPERPAALNSRSLTQVARP